MQQIKNIEFHCFNPKLFFRKHLLASSVFLTIFLIQRFLFQKIKCLSLMKRRLIQSFFFIPLPLNFLNLFNIKKDYSHLYWSRQNEEQKKIIRLPLLFMSEKFLLLITPFTPQLNIWCASCKLHRENFKNVLVNYVFWYFGYSFAIINDLFVLE